MTSMSLQPLHVLVTRPSPYGEKLSQAIQDAGGKAIHFPTINFKEPDDTTSLDLSELSQTQWLIFISPQAVKFGIAFLNKQSASLPSHVQIAAIGEGTARELRRSGWPVHTIPQEWSSEGLLALRQFSVVSSQKIIIVTGVKGSMYLDQALTNRGAKVQRLCVYERIIADTPLTFCLPWLRSAQINRIIATSYESLTNLCSMLGKDRILLWEIPLIVVSQRIKELALQLGFQRIWITTESSDYAILKCLETTKDVL